MKQVGIKPGNNHILNLTCRVVDKLPFKDEYFDIISSVAAFEHFLDVPTAVKEMDKVINGIV